MSDPSLGPGVRIPPPFLFVAGWLAGWALGRQFSFQIDSAGPALPQESVGLVLFAGGLLLIGWAGGTFARARTPIIPVKPARLVVTSGPFRWTRNPMYLGFTSAYLGLAVLLNQGWPIVFLPAVLLVLMTAVIDREEAHLLAKFGTEYDVYRRRVRRWL